MPCLFLGHNFTNFSSLFTIMTIVPEWISKELFQHSLKNVFNSKDIQILSFSSEDAVPTGNNFTSDLFRTTIIYTHPKSGNKNESISVIVKCRNEDGGVKQDFAKSFNLFESEVEMFSRTLPTIYEILGKYYVFSSKCFYTCIEPHAIIVLEDLTTLGFQMLPRQIGLDLEHCLKVVEKMAQMHGASVIMYEKDPSSVKNFEEGPYADQKLVRDWISTGYTALIDACSTWPGFEKYGCKMHKLGGELLERGFRAQKRRLDRFNVLNHGDSWINNMMFSYVDGKLKDLKFVDFQMNIFTSPVIDLHYFIATSANIEVILNHIQIIVDYYYTQLLATLVKLQYPLEKVPTREQFDKDFNSRASYGLMGAATVLPFAKAATRSDASFENIIKDNSKDGFRYHAYNNVRYRKHMEHLLPYYDSFDILD